MDYNVLGKSILDNIGGEENIQEFYHCATRLRFILNDPKKADKKKVETLKGVISVVESGGQFQVVIGNKVKDLYNVMTQDLNISTETAAAGKSQNKISPLNRLIDLLSGTFAPAFGLLAGSGLLKGIILLATFVGLQPDSGAYLILSAAADSLFYFLPIILAISAARKFKTDQFLAVVLAGALLHPTIVEALNSGQAVNFFGIPVILANYSSSVIPILFSVWILSKVEPFVKRFLHESIQTFIAPMICLVIMVPLTLIVVGPIATYVGNALADGYLLIYKLSPIISGIIIGALWQVFVIFGLHWAFIPIMINNIANLGSDTLMAMCTPAVVAQAGAALGVFLRSRDKQFKSLSFSAFITGLFGVTEPAIYGVNLRLKKPFIMGVISGAVGGAIIGAAGSRSTIFGTLSFVTFPAYFGKGFAAYAFSYFFSLVLACVLTYFFGGVKEFEAEDTIAATDEANIISPVAGELLPLEKVADETFSSGAMGEGFAVRPTSGKIVAPIEGEITMVFPTGHALGIRNSQGFEVLIHIGIDTVSMKGEGFVKHVSEGDQIKQGDLLIDFDPEIIKKAGLDPTVIVVFTNRESYKNVANLSSFNQSINEGSEIATLTL
ncbi:PTS glucose transporter subunit IIA [Enterococcus hulanensis]|uniref:beta-glucoside-specific PTS transporter subunit IIABC n=1 Tax=Enterococcus hulanensis TaxID=2559929 RepID=UPI001A8E8679|nr:beta-glucoside-specific PTS transporter subunit IIABC [Enterococcus hulanensis]MBO0457984.1 PTS glucose transporter subunit IIA [Enterococcus hulanensis]